MGWLADETGLERTKKNHVPLTPLSHLARAARVFAQHPAVIHGDRTWTCAEHHAPVSRLASALRQLGMPMMEEVAVLDDGRRPVPWDGRTQGEIGMRGNCVMKGYFRNAQAPEPRSPTAGSTRATSPCSTPTGTCRSSTAPTTSSSRAAGP